MAGEFPEDLRRTLTQYGQEHILRQWNELTPPERERLEEQIRSLNLGQLASLVEIARRSNQGVAGNDALIERANRAGPPSPIVRLPKTAEEQDRWREAHQRGEELLLAGTVGAILVAGGQGTRLGFDKPKGMYPIGVVSHAPLFQVLAEQVLARSRVAARAIPYFIMTSDATHDETIAFFIEHDFFGLDPDDVYFFAQGNMPAVDAESGKLLMSSDKTLSTSPDGHGGMLAALARTGMLEEMQRRGIEYLHYHQVDNPTAIVCDPIFLGFHSFFDAEMSVKVVAKRSAEERTGVAVAIDGKTQIIEYSDMPAEVARKTDPDGSLRLWAGSTAIHVFNRGFLERLVQGETALPFHVARKKVSYCDEQGQLVHPQAENAYKFEQFIFDALPLAERTLVLEADRAREFNPIKNAAGDDSPDTARAAMLRLHHEWLLAAGARVDASTPIEISPLFALDAKQVRSKVKPGTPFTEPTFLK
jgi:UDP-N-acetylglucosamine/UDP-N-acetylgalactosamine diphosphorylase